MSHKQTCVDHCKSYLSSISLVSFYSQSDFESYYRKHKGSAANAYKFALDVADYIIYQKNLTYKNATA